MADECSPLSWRYCYQKEGMEELKHSLLFTTLELEKTLISAKDEITKREFELIHVKDVLSKTMKERDEAQGRCQKLILEKFILHQQLLKQKDQQKEQQQQETASLSGLSTSEEDESKPGSSPDRNKSIVSSPGLEPQSRKKLPKEALKLAANRQLPEKGKLLQAVKDAGPLLQNLLLAGPLPQWQHPPPQLTYIDIPPVAISSPTQQLINQDFFNNLNGCLSKKRGQENYEAGFDSSPNTKYQKVALH